MRSWERLLTAACAGLLIAGAAGAASHSSPHPAAAVSKVTSTTRSAPTTSTSTTTVAVGPPGPSTDQLNAGLITPTDMGGYYRVEPQTGQAMLDSAPCLAGLQPSPAQSGRALQGLVGPDLNGLPTIVETVASFRGSSAAAVYRNLLRALSSSACATFGFAFAATQERVTLSPLSIPAVGDNDSAWQGQFTLQGRAMQLQIGLVQQGQVVINLVYVDSVPPSDAIMGTFPSTLSAAIGKLA